MHTCCCRDSLEQIYRCKSSTVDRRRQGPLEESKENEWHILRKDSFARDRICKTLLCCRPKQRKLAPHWSPTEDLAPKKVALLATAPPSQSAVRQIKQLAENAKKCKYRKNLRYPGDRMLCLEVVVIEGVQEFESRRVHFINLQCRFIPPRGGTSCSNKFFSFKSPKIQF